MLSDDPHLTLEGRLDQTEAADHVFEGLLVERPARLLHNLVLCRIIELGDVGDFHLLEDAGQDVVVVLLLLRRLIGPLQQALASSRQHIRSRPLISLASIAIAALEALDDDLRQ